MSPVDRHDVLATGPTAQLQVCPSSHAGSLRCRSCFHLVYRSLLLQGGARPGYCTVLVSPRRLFFNKF